MGESLPIGIRNFGKVEELRDKVVACLATGVGSNNIKEMEILNDF
jgi:hypothetical protein